MLRAELHAVTWHELTADVLPGAAVAPRCLALVLTAAQLRRPHRLRLPRVRLHRQAPAGGPGRRWPRSCRTPSRTTSASRCSPGASVRYRFYSRWGLDRRRALADRVLVLGHVLARAAGARRDQPGGQPDGGARGLGAALTCVLPAGCWPVPRSRMSLRRCRAARPVPHRPLPLSAADAARSRSRSCCCRSSTGRSPARCSTCCCRRARVPFLAFLGAFLAAILLGMASHVPGGLGVFEGLMVLLLKPYLRRPMLLPALVVYRAVYYLLPLVGRARRPRRRRSCGSGGAGGARRPRCSAASPSSSRRGCFGLLHVLRPGAILLFSGATPAAPGRLELLDRVLPLGVIEASHFTGSVAGAALLLLSQGLARRLDAAYYLHRRRDRRRHRRVAAQGRSTTRRRSLLGVRAGGPAGAPGRRSIAAPRSSRRASRRLDRGRRSARSARRCGSACSPSSTWTIRSELWWQFELHGEASRFLRASVGAAVVVLLFGDRAAGAATRRTRWPSRPTHDLRRRRRRSSPRSRATSPHLVFLRDKALLFNDDRTGVRDVRRAGPHLGGARRSGRARTSAVSRPDPAVPRALRRLRRRAGVLRGRHGAPASLRRLRADVRQARRGGAGRSRRRSASKGRAARATASRSAGWRRTAAPFRDRRGRRRARRSCPQLRAVSDDWLADTAGAEKGFSLGFFDDDYLARFPVAVVRCEGADRRVRQHLAGRRATGALDRPDALRPARAEGRDGGAVRAPAAVGQGAGLPAGSCWAWRRSPGIEQSPVASLWNRLGSFLYRARRSGLPLPGPAGVQGEVRSGLGAALSRVPGRDEAAAHPGRRLGAGRRRLSPDLL